MEKFLKANRGENTRTHTSEKRERERQRERDAVVVELFSPLRESASSSVLVLTKSRKAPLLKVKMHSIEGGLP